MGGENTMSYVKSELSQNNKYWIPRHRYFELKHFCLQYPEWKKEYIELLSTYSLPRLSNNKSRLEKRISDHTGEIAIKRLYYAERIKIVENIAIKVDESIYEYLLKGVTEDKSYTYLKTYCDIPCGKDYYYDRYRCFFWLLDKERQ